MTSNADANDGRVVLAVVGSTSFVRPEAPALARRIIAAYLFTLPVSQMVSGGAAGVDTIAREVGAEFGHLTTNGGFLEFLPRYRRWEPDGFKARNIVIAQACTHLLAIRCHASKTYGSGWTADYAEQHGRIVYRVTL